MSIYELVSAAREINNKLTLASNSIIELENGLRKEGIQIPFKMKIEENHWLAWNWTMTTKTDGKKGKKNWRVFLITGDVDQQKALIETNIETRLRFCPFLGKFIEEFTNHLQLISKKISENKFIKQLENIQSDESPDGDDEALFEKINGEYPDDLPY